jgi:hypothetical protein
LSLFERYEKWVLKEQDLVALDSTKTKAYRISHIHISREDDHKLDTVEVAVRTTDTKRIRSWAPRELNDPMSCCVCNAPAPEHLVNLCFMKNFLDGNNARWFEKDGSSKWFRY